MGESAVDEVREGLRLQVPPFTASQALASGRLQAATQSPGLSLGKRCCLSPSHERRSAQGVTAGRLCKGLEGVRVTSIR